MFEWRCLVNHEYALERGVLHPFLLWLPLLTRERTKITFSTLVTFANKRERERLVPSVPFSTLVTFANKREKAKITFSTLVTFANKRERKQR
ncbi:hypothetical protein [Cedratvirus kamchatka]|uniref:Uncharacterized protein n=1 Tax=Cedratvirus kamchatka TaxID=2716914 RepID=A0A6G8MZD9_9VIRU|nr:hypothetical protein [Cedratvirus kamchatka]